MGKINIFICGGEVSGEKKKILKQECKINTAEISMSRALRIGEGISIRLKGKGWWRIGDFRNIWFGLIADTCVIPLFLLLGGNTCQAISTPSPTPP